jgi:predicted helicase
MIDKNGDGVLGMITNHAYLDNPTFRGMRWHLTKTFDKIYILDLHGNAKKKEISPDGSKDENVFDIMQGVSIIIAVKNNQKKKEELAKVYYADTFGTRKNKFKALNENIEWKKIELDQKLFYLVDKNIDGKDDYENGVAINELFNISSIGVVTSGDSILIADSKERLIKQIRNAKENPQRGKIYERLANHEVSESFIKPITYRPFDDQYIYYAPGIVERSREKVMKEFFSDNIGLLIKRQSKQDFSYVFLVDKIAESCIFESAYANNTVCPLYIHHSDGVRTANFDQKILKEFSINLVKSYEPEDILDYIYAVLHSQKYREKYKEFLKIDFPRVPAPENDSEFIKLVKFGKELRELHLMTSPTVNDITTTYPVAGSNSVEKVIHEDGNVYINNDQLFGNVPELAWSFYIGGYQPAQKWLKDRKGKILTNEDIEHYQKIIKILVETGRIMKEIDKVWA